MMLIIYMAICAGYAGGSLPYSNILDKEIEIFGKKINFTWLPEAFLALPFGFMQDGYITGALAIAWSYALIQSATAPALHWGQGGYNPDRTSTLKPFVDWLNGKTIKADPSTAAYCRLYMGVKGFLIGLPTGPGAIITAVLWPSSYEIGHRMKWPHWTKECLTGAAAAVAILAVLHGTDVRGINE